MTAFTPERIAIIGQGPVSLALRLFLLRQGFRACDLVVQPVSDRIPEALAARAIAVSAGSLDLLERIAQAPAGAAITTVDIARAGAAGHVQLQAAQFQREVLGRVVRYRQLHATLATAQAHVRPWPDAELDASPDITIIADGDPGEEADRREFGQFALQAELQVSHDRPGVAFERFTDEGPLALLPLPDPQRRALVWCAPQAQSHSRQSMPAEAFERALLSAFGSALGRLRLDSARLVSPISRRRRRQTPGTNTVAIGNAAQSLHPVAGQGFNLGLRDAFVLASYLGESRVNKMPLHEALRAFEAARRYDRDLTCGITDQLAQLPQIEFLRPLQSLGLTAIGQCQPLARAIGRGFMFGFRGFR